MKKQFATFLTAIFLIQRSLFAFEVELNASYDYFRGIPDGSWNGNSGAYISANSSLPVFDCVALQLGGSFGIYNWDGRQNLVFKNSKYNLNQGFVTVGASTSYNQFNFGIAYDHMFSKHFGLYDLSPSIGQVRYQLGYQFCQDEIGLWGTAHTNTPHKSALGIPTSFRAINQLNAFWTHAYNTCAITTLWIGAPFGNSLIHSHGSAGVITAGFFARVPLQDRFYLDAHGSYMRAKKAHGAHQSRNYGANIAVGITYLFGSSCESTTSSYLPLVNNSLFLVDTNHNQ